MGLRMAEYSLAISRRFGRLPGQVVLYVGDAPARMKMRLEGPHLAFECPVVDVRDLDGERWLASDRVEDNIVAVLMRFGNEPDTIRRILKKIALSDRAGQAGVLAELLVLAGLRKIGDIIRREAERMPILNDIMDHEVFGPLLNQGRAEGRAEGERNLVLRKLGQRFGRLPNWARNRVEAMSTADIDRIVDDLPGAAGLEDLLR